MFIDNEPDEWPRGDLTTPPLFGVLYWRVTPDWREHALQIKGAEQLALEEDNYDWRGIHLLNNKMLRRLVERTGGTWRDLLD